MTCKDCIHYDICIDFKHYWERKRCKFFKDKSKIVEIPDVERGQEVYFIFDKVDGKYRIRKGRIYQFEPMQVKIATEFMTFDLTLRLGESAFLTKEEAEAKVKELNDDKL